MAIYFSFMLCVAMLTDKPAKTVTVNFCIRENLSQLRLDIDSTTFILSKLTLAFFLIRGLLFAAMN